MLFMKLFKLKGMTICGSILQILEVVPLLVIPWIEGLDIRHMVIIGLAIQDWRSCFLPERLSGRGWGRCLEIILGRLFLMDLVLTRSKYHPK